MEEESSSTFLGSYIHETIPDALHVNPYQTSVNPCKEIQQSTFSFQQYKLDLERRDVEQEEEDEVERHREPNHEHINNENDLVMDDLFDTKENTRSNRSMNGLNTNQNDENENVNHESLHEVTDVSESGIELLHRDLQEEHRHSLLALREQHEQHEQNQPVDNSIVVEQIVEVEDSDTELEEHVNTPVRRALNSFGNFIFDIYQSSAYYLPSQYSPSRNRFQYINEYYRRMVHLIEASNKQEAASEETIEHLCVDIFFSVDWCPICLEDYLDNMVTTVLPCGHRFHLCCIRSWLQINHKCPVCKIVV